MLKSSLVCLVALMFLPAQATPEVGGGPLNDVAHWTTSSTPELLVELAKREESLDPEDSRTLARAGHIMLRAGKTTEAAALFDHAQKSDPKDDEAFVMIAMAYSERKMWSEADAWFAKAVEQDPKDTDHSIEWGVSYWNRGQKDKAAQLFTKALQSEAKNKRINYKIGRGIQ